MFTSRYIFYIICFYGESLDSHSFIALAYFRREEELYQKNDIVYFCQTKRRKGLREEPRVERTADFYCHIFHSKVE